MSPGLGIIKPFQQTEYEAQLSCPLVISTHIVSSLTIKSLAIGISLPVPLPSPEVKDECWKPQPFTTTPVFLMTIPHLKDTQGVWVITRFISIQHFNDFKDFNMTRYRQGINKYTFPSITHINSILRYTPKIYFYTESCAPTCRAPLFTISKCANLTIYQQRNKITEKYYWAIKNEGLSHNTFNDI